MGIQAIREQTSAAPGMSVLVTTTAAAAELEVGDFIQNSDGPVGEVEEISILQRVEVMYNLTVDTAHTYFVGDGQWLVHNSCPWQVGRANEMNSRGDGLDLHHAPQASQAEGLIPGYNRRTGPVIAIDPDLHGQIPIYTGPAPAGMTPRDLLARDIWNLCNVRAPNSSLRQLIDLTKNIYPGSF